MKVSKNTGAAERQIITAMILSDSVCGKITANWSADLFASKWASLVAGWCAKYHAEYGKAPGRDIANLYEAWQGETEDDESARAVQTFLASISDAYERGGEMINGERILDLAEKTFERNRLQSLIDEMQGDIDAGQASKATEKLNAFHKTELTAGAGVHPLTDKEVIREAFEQKNESLISFPGALGKFFSDHLCRDGFISFLGPEKSGKSFWLQEIVLQAIRRRLKCAYFQVGDMSQAQVIRRLMTRLSGWPMRPKTIKIPKELSFGLEGPEVDFDFKHYETGLSWRRAIKYAERFEERLKSKTPILKLSTHPADTLSVRQIDSILDGWERDGWMADVIVIDYADILDLGGGDRQERDKINASWKALRGMSQRRHCLLVTATQANTASYSSKILDRQNFSEDKRKLSHVTGMIGINQTPDERLLQLQRLNWVVLREGNYHVTQCVYCAGCLEIGRPGILSAFRPRKH